MLLLFRRKLVPTKLPAAPPMRLGAPAPVRSGSKRKARWLPTRTSKGWLFVLPMNWPGARLLPPSCQKPAAATPPSATAFTLDNVAPLPANPPAAETAPEKLGLAGSDELRRVPLI